MTDPLDRHVLAAMREAATRAILPRFTPGRALDAEFKSAGEAVTAADRESEAILTERLEALLPGVPVVGEEAVHAAPEQLERLSGEACWIIDPLDGTNNFAAGTGPFGVLVALAERGLPVAGLDFDPLGGRACVAHRGRGALIDGVPFRVPAPGAAPLQVAVTRLFADARRRERLVATLSAHCTVLDSPRCAADQYPRVALGENDSTLFTRTIAWDHAAGVVFLNEAGGKACRQDGRSYRCDEPDDGLLIATCPQRWERVARWLEADGERLAGAHLVQD